MKGSTQGGGEDLSRLCPHRSLTLMAGQEGSQAAGRQKEDGGQDEPKEGASSYRFTSGALFGSGADELQKMRTFLASPSGSTHRTRVLAQANHSRVKRFGSSLWKASCMNPVPPWVVFNSRRHMGDLAVLPRGQRAHDDPKRPDLSMPAWGPPSPSPTISTKVVGVVRAQDEASGS